MIERLNEVSSALSGRGKYLKTVLSTLSARMLGHFGSTAGVSGGYANLEGFIPLPGFKHPRELGVSEKAEGPSTAAEKPIPYAFGESGNMPLN
jgi:hypothetical protein